MKYDFDEVISREGTNCEKLDARERLYGRGDVIPLWVADMEFAAPPAVLNAIRKRAEHPILGYSYRSDQYWNSIIGWVEQLQEVDTAGVAPMTSVVDLLLPERRDEITDGNCREGVLANAPERIDCFYSVPKVVE